MPGNDYRGQLWGIITPALHAQAERLLETDEGDDRLPLEDCPLAGTPVAAELWCEEIVETWESTLQQIEQELGHDEFTLRSISIYLVDDGSMLGEQDYYHDFVDLRKEKREALQVKQEEQVRLLRSEKRQ